MRAAFRRQFVRCVWGLIIIVATGVTHVWAAPPKQDRVTRAQAHVDAGDALFAEKKFEQAIVEYTAALALAPHPDLIWNIGRAHEELRRFVQAVYYFERYLALDISENDRVLAQGRIDVLRPKAKAARRGTLVVKTPSDDCAVVVGGLAVGKGQEVISALKAGRYRVRVTRPGYKAFESVVRVEVARQVTVEAKLEPTIPPCELVLSTDAPAVSVSVDGAEPVRGAKVKVQAGEHQIRVTADRRLGASISVTCKGGETVEKSVRLGPVRHPERFTDWAGSFRLAVRQEGGPTAALAGGVLTLDAGGTGELIQSGQRTLERWRAKNCGGNAELTWTQKWVVRLAGGKLLLTDGKVTECSCPAYCRLSEEIEIPVRVLPGFEGMVADSAFVLREGLPGAGVSHHTPTSLELTDRWEAEDWPADGRAESMTAVADGSARLIVTRSGDIPSYRRSKCGGADRFEQVIEYRGALTRRGHEVVWAPASMREVSCSCEGACGQARLETNRVLEVVPFTRYVVGPGVLLRRSDAEDTSGAKQANPR